MWISVLMLVIGLCGLALFWLMLIWALNRDEWVKVSRMPRNQWVRLDDYTEVMRHDDDSVSFKSRINPKTGRGGFGWK